MQLIIGILCSILLTPTMLIFLNFLLASLELIQQIMLFGNSGDPRLMSGVISEFIVLQLVWLSVLLPGVLMCTLAVFKYKILELSWFRKLMKSFAVLQMLTFPLVSTVGFYVYWLSKRHR